MYKYYAYITYRTKKLSIWFSDFEIEMKDEMSKSSEKDQAVTD